MVQDHLVRVRVRAGARVAEEDGAAATVLARGRAAVAFAEVVAREFRTVQGFRAIRCNVPSAARR